MRTPTIWGFVFGLLVTWFLASLGVSKSWSVVGGLIMLALGIAAANYIDYGIFSVFDRRSPNTD